MKRVHFLLLSFWFLFFNIYAFHFSRFPQSYLAINFNNILNKLEKTFIGSKDPNEHDSFLSNSNINFFINPKSGGKEGKLLYTSFKNYYGKKVLCDLSHESPEKKLKVLLESNENKLNNQNQLAICCGGDGTIRWVMEAFEKLKEKKISYENYYQNQPNYFNKKDLLAKNDTELTFGIVPMGTGNDLFNHLLLTKFEEDPYKQYEVREKLSIDHLTSSPSVISYLFSSYDKNSTTRLDRWTLQIQPLRGFFRRKFHTNKLNSLYKIIKNKINKKLLKQKSENNNNNNSDDVNLSIEKQFSSNSVTLPIDKLSLNISEKLITSNKVNSLIFNNYYGIGLDGDISLTFDYIRRLNPSLFFSSIINKLIYAAVWGYKFIKSFDKSSADSSSFSPISYFYSPSSRILTKDKIEIICDGQTLDIDSHEVEGIIFINIKSYAGGTKLWTPENYEEKENWKEQDSDDGLIEIIGLTSLTHLASVKTGLSSTIPLGQCREVSIVAKKKLPMQVDGEPWLQPPCIINLRSESKVNLLIPS